MESITEGEIQKVEGLMQEISATDKEAQTSLVKTLIELNAKYKELLDLQKELAGANSDLEDKNSTLEASLKRLEKELADALETNTKLTQENQDLVKSKDDWKAAFHRVHDGLNKMLKDRQESTEALGLATKKVSFKAATPDETQEVQA